MGEIRLQEGGEDETERMKNTDAESGILRCRLNKLLERSEEERVAEMKKRKLHK